MNRKSLRVILTMVILSGIAALLVWGWLRGDKERAMDAGGERPVKAPSRVSVADGEVVVAVDETERRKSGIAVASPAPLSRRGEQRATGVVLPLQELFDGLNAFAAAKAQAERARANLSASRAEYERLKLLNADDRNVSDKALQAAEAAWRGDEASLQAASASVKALSGSLRQRWGGVIAGWVREGGAPLERLARQEDRLLQVTFLPDVRVATAPRTIRLQTAGGAPSIAARLVSPAPATDPRIQGISFLYLAPARSGLLPGMNVPARLPVGPMVQGVVVPDAAVVWWQGKAWAYLEKGADRFVRREIPTSAPVDGGYFTAGGLSADDRVVVSGAQLLLSEEFRPRIKGGGEGDDD
ncbi:efflux RND transporter periplasmic adaptor subunit [Geomonas oryzae]|uniref:efflux RND transporter periplasmic adaptor subunit n=1 Tax=Geomonas oryzae TaxID=2364273 RepID=UPI00100B8BF0|nr:multidrug transporter [Geomonas oryzae]